MCHDNPHNWAILHKWCPLPIEEIEFQDFFDKIDWAMAFQAFLNKSLLHSNFQKKRKKGKSILQVPDTGTRVLDNTRPFLHSSIISFWITPTHSKECTYHIFRQYWYTKNVPVFTNTGTFQYLGPEVYFSKKERNPHRHQKFRRFQWKCLLSLNFQQK